MKKENTKQKFHILVMVLLVLVFLGQGTGQMKLKVIVDDARVNETPEIRGKTLARLSLNAIVDAEVKEGEWYKVSLELEGVKINGYMHEILVEAMSEEELAAVVSEALPSFEETQEEIIVEIQSTMDEGRELIRSDRDLENAVVSLRPLIARAFRVTDDQTQRELAAEIFLWIGMGYAGLDNHKRAFEEIRSMFEVDYLYAKEITRNIFDPKIVSIIQFAEAEFLGNITEYSVTIATVPEKANIKINGEDVGFSPGAFRANSPIVKIEIAKEGYRSVQDEVFLTQDETRKEYTLESLGRNVFITSDPPGAKVYLDGEDTGELTNCMLPLVPFGAHTLQIVKDSYLAWMQEFSLEVSGDPYNVDAVLTGASYEYLKKWGGVNLDLFKSPQGIALDEKSYMYIVDDSKEKLRKFTPEGKPVLSWIPKGLRYRGIKNPSGIAIDIDGYIYVTDVKEHCVWKFDKNGNFIKTWGKEGTERDKILRPTGISINSKNEVYVVDSGNLSVKVYSSLGVLKSIFEKPKNMGLLVGVAVGPNDDVWVLDTIRVYRFSPEGKFISEWGQRGSKDGEFGNPKGIFVDGFGHIYIADAANNRIQKFSSEGKFITKWGEPGAGVGRFNFPTRISVDKNGLVYVIDLKNNRIQVFKIAGQEAQ